jgi:hypothetical protein
MYRILRRTRRARRGNGGPHAPGFSSTPAPSRSVHAATRSSTDLVARARMRGARRLVIRGHCYSECIKHKERDLRETVENLSADKERPGRAALRFAPTPVEPAGRGVAWLRALCVAGMFLVSRPDVDRQRGFRPTANRKAQLGRFRRAECFGALTPGAGGSLE